MSAVPPELRRALRAAGTSDDFEDIVLNPAGSQAAGPVLLDWLLHVDERVPRGPEQTRLRQTLVRARAALNAARPVVPIVGTPPELAAQLSAVGLPGDVWDMVNLSSDYPQAIPILLDWLEHFDERVPSDARRTDRLREGIVRALTVRSARPAAAPLLLSEFRRTESEGLRWAIGNALSVVADDRMLDDLLTVAKDRSFGRSRQMIVVGLSRLKPRAAVLPVLLDLLDDGDVAAHAALALGRMKAREAGSRLEELSREASGLLQREAREALARIPRS